MAMMYNREVGISYAVYTHTQSVTTCHFVFAKVTPYREVWGVDVDTAAGFERSPLC